MRGARSTLVMLVVFLALGAYVYLVEMNRRPASEAPPSEQLFEVDADTIETLTVRTGGDATSLRRSADAWQIIGPIEAVADDTTIASIASAISTIEIRRVVDEGPVDLEPFGLSSPTVDLSFTVADDGTDHRLLIGETSPTGVDRYAKVASEDRLLLVSASVESTFNKSTFDLRDKTILDFETAGIDQLTINLADSTLEFSKSDNEWRLTQPWDVRADFGTVEGLVGRMSSGQMLSVATEDIAEAEATATEEDSIDYGLTEPSVTATVRAGSAEATLAVGAEAPRGERYARDASRSLVFTVEDSLVADLERDAIEYRRKDLFTFRSFNATRLEVEQTQATVAFEKTAAAGEGTEEAWTRTEPEASDVERSDMDDLLSKISNLRAESFIESRSEAALSDANVIATIRVTYGEEDADERVVFWRSDEDTYGVNGDEAGAGIVDTRSVDDALEALETLLGPES